MEDFIQQFYNTRFSTLQGKCSSLVFSTIGDLHWFVAMLIENSLLIYDSFILESYDRVH